MIAIIDYGAGNTTSVKNALDRLGAASIVTKDFDAIQSASKVIFPGVGEANRAMQNLRAENLDQ